MKTRQNISIDPEVLEILKDLASVKKTSISGLITRWVMDEYEAKSRIDPSNFVSGDPTPMITGLPPTEDQHEKQA